MSCHPATPGPHPLPFTGWPRPERSLLDIDSSWPSCFTFSYLFFMALYSHSSKWDVVSWHLLSSCIFTIFTIYYICISIFTHIIFTMTLCPHLGGRLPHHMACRGYEDELAVWHAQLISADPLPLQAGEWQGNASRDVG